MAPLVTAATAPDPTLEAIDKAIVLSSLLEEARPYVGMSSIGEECGRKLWYRFRWATKETFDALSLKRFADGHASEDVQATRLRMVEGINLVTLDEKTGKQIGYVDLDGHFRGHCDGEIQGIIQAPKTWHIWEHKAVAEKSQNELVALKKKHGEKNALEHWKPVYYAQAILYMHYSGFERHYMTVSTPGGRHTISVRTEANPAEALRLIGKAKKVIESQEPLAKISKTGDYFQCKWCAFNGVCHKDEQPELNCRTCLHSTPVKNGEWHCAKFDFSIPLEAQRKGCASHLYIPALVPGEVTDVGNNYVTYTLKDGSTYTNQGE